VDVEHAEAIEQVAAEPRGGHPGVQVPVRRRDQPDVGFERRRSPDALVLPFLQHAQPFHPHRRREVADLVEEARAAGRELEAPRLLSIRARESTRSWPNSSDSRSVSGSVAQFTATNGPSAHRLA
jgi:hypothetical protein